MTQRAQQLEALVGELRDQSAPWTQRKSELLGQATAPGLWDNRSAAQALFDEVYRIDGVLQALEELGRAVAEQVEAAHRRRMTDRDLARVDERLDTLEGRARHVAALVSCRNPRELVDAFVILTRVARHGVGLEAVATLARMYVHLAQHHNLEVEILDDHRDGDPQEDVIVLQISGAGAYALLAAEAGLHQVSRGRGASRNGRRNIERDVVRVEVLPVPAEEDARARESVEVEVHPLEDPSGRLMNRPRLEVLLHHTPSLLTLRAWTDKGRSEGVERLRPLLWARLAAAERAQAEGRPCVVRRYALGPAPLVRDVRSGRSTGRLEQVLGGNLDIFLVPSTEPGSAKEP